MSVVSFQVAQYYRGERLFLDGKPCPPRPSDDCTGCEPHSILWIGYRVAMAMDFMERCKIAEQLNMPAPEWPEPPVIGQ